MVHYTCDMCGKHIHPEEDTRYVIKVEIHSAGQPEDEEDFEDMDELEEYEQDEMEDDEEMEYDALRFDLCSKCHKIYIQDPLFIKGHRSRFFNN
jgi:DNA-directed RNA polymerase subunit RPC12/RpoP